MLRFQQNGLIEIDEMKIKALHILACVFLLSVALSCDREGDALRVPISFTTEEYSVDLRSEQVNPVDFQSFGVFSMVNGEPLMNNVEIRNKGSYWSADTPYYWPQKAGSYVDFYAYSPYASLSNQSDDEGFVFAFDDETGKPKFTFTMSDKADMDLMVAKAEGCTAAGGPVRLEFRHLLCKVKFSFSVSNEGGYSYLVNTIKVNGTPLVADYDWTSDVFDIKETGTVSVHIDGGGDSNLIDSTEPIVIEDFTMFLMPGDLKEIEVIINNDAPKTIYLSDVELDANLELTVHFEVSLNGINFTTSVNKWVDGGTAAGNIS